MVMEHCWYLLFDFAVCIVYILYSGTVVGYLKE